MPWCRKCRRFSKTFFVESGRARRQSGRCKTSDFFGQKYGCFASKVRMFPSKKSDVFVFRKGYATIRTLYSLSPSGGHRHHVRMHIINKVLLHLGDMDAPTVGRNSRIWNNRCRPFPPSWSDGSILRNKTIGVTATTISAACCDAKRKKLTQKPW